MIITGSNRSGTSLMLLLIAGTVRPSTVDVVTDGESSLGWDDDKIISKNPSALTEIKALRNPIIMFRDPRAVVTSQIDGQYFVNGDVTRNGKDAGVIKNYLVMEKGYAAKCWFQYEHLVRWPDAMQIRVGAHWGLDFEREFSDFPNLPRLKGTALTWAKKLNDYRAIDFGHDWREHMQRIRQQFDAFPELFSILKRHGYEQDDTWYEEVLDQTEPQKYERPEKKVAKVKPKAAKISFKVNA